MHVIYSSTACDFTVVMGTCHITTKSHFSAGSKHTPLVIATEQPLVAMVQYFLPYLLQRTGCSGSACTLHRRLHGQLPFFYPWSCVQDSNTLPAQEPVYSDMRVHVHVKWGREVPGV